MNTVKTFWLGWGALCVAGGGAYVVAKRSINADRLARYEEQRKKKTVVDSLEYGDDLPSHPGSSSTAAGGVRKLSEPPNTDPVGSPSREQAEPAPTRHAPTTEEGRVLEKSKYETATPFRSKKGDRFSSIV